MTDVTPQAAPAETAVIEADEFASLLQKEFRPRSDRARDEVESAVRTLAEQALSSTALVSDDAVSSIEAIIAELDRRLTEQVNLILHHESFQACESAWRGLSHLVFNTETDENLKIRVMNVSKQELYGMFRVYKDVKWDQSPLFKRVYEAEYGQFGGEPFGCLVGDYHFDQSAPDVELLTELARTSAAAMASIASSLSVSGTMVMGMGKVPARPVKEVTSGPGPSESLLAASTSTAMSSSSSMSLRICSGRVPSRMTSSGSMAAISAASRQTRSRWRAASVTGWNP